MAGITKSISAANSGGTSDVANLTENSFVSINTGDGPNTVLIDLSGSWSGTGGLLALFVPTQSPTSTTQTSLVRTIPQTDIVAQSNNNTNGLVSAVTGSFSLGVNGAGTVYIVGPSDFSGPASVTLRVGPGSPSNSGAGNDVVILGQSLTQYRSNNLVTATLFSGAKKLKSVTGYNPGSTLYLQIWDNATAGSGSLVYETEITLGVAAAPTVGGDLLTPDYITIGTACTYGWSTTSGTYTAFGGSPTGLRCEVLVSA